MENSFPHTTFLSNGNWSPESNSELTFLFSLLPYVSFISQFKITRSVNIKIHCILFLACMLCWVAGIAQWYSDGLRAGWSGVRVQIEVGNVLFPHRIRIGSGPTQPPIPWVLGALSLGIKGQECEADHSPSSSVEVKEYVELYFHSPSTPS
jgi:hypothetical protein